MAFSSTSSIQKTFKYDVFLSFRGEDTRRNFIDHLYLALKQKDILVYKDDETIQKGKRISDELIRAIEDSKLYIIVFSKNYVSSSWCLDELVKIMECQRMTEHTAYPVFYDVEPTEIRKQSGSVGKAFANHEKEEDTRKWKDALKEAASLAGWELKNTTDGHEAKFIQKIVKEISMDLRFIDLSFDEKLVGMEARVKDVVSSLDIDTDDVRMIGIKGMGGGGKTTLARAVFDQISMEFEGSSFVENVREVSNDASRGLKSLQKQVLSDVLNDQRIGVSGIFDGKNKLKRMLRCRKVLVILDDVDHIDQLEALAGGPNWFKPGSRIIITTRDEKVLVAHKVNFILNVNLLSYMESICLFSRYAFGKEIPIKEYEVLSMQVVRYADGLPLTIKVLGSFLCGESEDIWRDAIERLRTIPLKETLEILEISYNGLEEDCKEIFLDVVCILKGWKIEEAIRALKSCQFHAKIGLKVLEQKSLITTIYDHKLKDWVLGMHDHIEEMGKNIVRRLHPNEPHKHSRLWEKEEIEDILSNDLGTTATRCIHLVNSELHPATIMKGLKEMKGLRFLYVKDDCKKFDRRFDVLSDKEFNVSSEYLPESLQFLTWEGYPFTCLPKNFQVKNVVPPSRKVPNELKFLDISGSKLRTLDLGSTPNLETLILSYCYNLVELHIHGETSKLKFVDLSYSDQLRIIHLGRSANLEVLSFKCCWNLEELHMPAGSVKSKSLDLFDLSKLRILNLWQTLNLEKLDMRRCENLVELHVPAELKYLRLEYSKLRTLDLAQIRNLEKIKIVDCNNLSELHMPVESLKLRQLVLTNSKLRTLDLSRMLNIEMLYLYKCEHLVELHMPFKSLKLILLELANTKLRTLDLTRTPNLEILRLEECENLVEPLLLAVCSLRCLRELTLDGNFLEVLKDLHQLQCLQDLSLSSTKIKHLPSSICMLKHLEVLRLQSCLFLERLPEDLGRLKCLVELILSSEKIKHLSNSICMLRRLKVLKLESCFLLEKLPEDIGGLECLETLILTECIFLRVIPNSICELKHLKTFHLTYCFLVEKLPEELGRLKCLKELDIEGSGITHLPRSFFQLKGLRINGSRWRLESYGFEWFQMSSPLSSRYSASSRLDSMGFPYGTK